MRCFKRLIKKRTIKYSLYNYFFDKSNKLLITHNKKILKFTKNYINFKII